MRRYLPLVSGLALALVASTAVAADAPTRRSARTDLLASHRQAQPELELRRTDDRAATRLGAERLEIGRLTAPIVSLPDVPPMSPMGLGDMPLTSLRGSIMEVEGLEPRASRGAWVVNGVRITDDPAVQRALESRSERRPALVAHGLSEDGTERLFQLR